MDFATLIGVVGAIGLIASAVILGVSSEVFINPAAALFVMGGSLLVVLSTLPMNLKVCCWPWQKCWRKYPATSPLKAIRITYPSALAGLPATGIFLRPGPERIRVTAMADTNPRVANTSADNRAQNRRVEIILDLAEEVEEEVIRLQELMNCRPQNDREDTLTPTIEPVPSGDGDTLT